MIHPVLRRYWPPEDQIRLLKVALAEPEIAEPAWSEWIAHRNLDTASWTEARLLATASKRVREFDPTSPLLRRLEGIRRFMWANTQLNINSARPLLVTLCDAGVRLMLLKGAARLALDPQSSADRYFTDIDVLVHLDDWPKTLELAKSHGCRTLFGQPFSPKFFPYHHSMEIQADGGALIDLHHLALFMCRNAGDDDNLWRRARSATFRGLQAVRAVARRRGADLDRARAALR